MIEILFTLSVQCKITREVIFQQTRNARRPAIMRTSTVRFLEGNHTRRGMNYWDSSYPASTRQNHKGNHISANKKRTSTSNNKNRHCADSQQQSHAAIYSTLLAKIPHEFDQSGNIAAILQYHIAAILQQYCQTGQLICQGRLRALQAS